METPSFSKSFNVWMEVSKRCYFGKSHLLSQTLIQVMINALYAKKRKTWLGMLSCYVIMPGQLGSVHSEAFNPMCFTHCN